MDTHPSEDSSQSLEHSDVWSDDVAGNETDLTVPTDVADSAWLLADNDHLPEYYLRLAKDFDGTEDAKEDYSPGTTLNIRSNQIVHDETRPDYRIQTSHTAVRAPIWCGKCL